MTLLPHCSGPWLARVGKRNFSIPPELGRALLPMQGEPLLAERVKALLPENPPLAEAVMSWNDPMAPDASQWHGQRIIWGQMSLVPENVVRWLSAHLEGFASNEALTRMAVTGIIAYAAFFVLLQGGAFSTHVSAAVASKNISIVLSGLGLFLLTGIWHELGHGAAISREGYKPGRIGIGFLVVIPVLFAEVTAVSMLPRQARLRVDFSGMVFQLNAGGLMLVFSMACLQWEPLAVTLQVAGFSSLVAVFWSLLPFVRSDGYWALADYLGVDNLDAPWGDSGSKSRATAWFMIVFRVANIGFLVFLGMMIPLRLIRWLQFLGWSYWEIGDWRGIVFQILISVVFGVIWVGLGRHGYKLGQASLQDFKDLVNI